MFIPRAKGLFLSPNWCPHSQINFASYKAMCAGVRVNTCMRVRESKTALSNKAL